MSSPSYDTQEKPEQQDWADQEWEEMVKLCLPANLEEKAIELKAWCRQRGVRSIADLLRALLVYASSGYSFQDLGIWATLKGVGNISATAWRKRFDKSAPWIDWLVCDMLQGEASESSSVMSSWRISQFSLGQVKTMLRGTWPTKRIIACLDQLHRYFFTRPRKKRPHQQTGFQVWLSHKMGALAGAASP